MLKVLLSNSFHGELIDGQQKIHVGYLGDGASLALRSGQSDLNGHSNEKIDRKNRLLVFLFSELESADKLDAWIAVFFSTYCNWVTNFL